MKLNYRPEIDGLRAIAVIAVILYHAQISKFFYGGYVGVDIFFVISGYLITSIIFKELLNTNSFNFKYFFERRIRRIIPVLLIMKLAVLPFALVLLPPSRLIEFSTSALYSLGFVSNIYFYYTGLQYEALEGLFVPLLHTWSLSVEEQFYLLFPVLFFIIFRYLNNKIFLFLSSIILISLVLSEIYIIEDKSFVFYSTFTRVWELIIGSLLAYFEYRRPERSNNNKILNSAMPILGIILILLTIFLFDDKTRHPSILTLIPVIGTAIIIWFANRDNLITKILSNKYLVFIGLISYSLYIWHYPIFAFAKISGWTSGSFVAKIILGFITISISIISYFFIENIFRNKKFRFKYILYSLIFTSIVIIFCNLFIINKNGFPERFKNLKEINKNYNLDNFYLEKKRLSNDFHLKNTFDLNKKNILIIGDSHADDFRNMFFENKELFEEYDFLSLLKNNININNDIELLKNHKLVMEAEYIIFSYRWTQKIIEEVFNELIPHYKSLNKKIIITSSVNEYYTPSKMYTLLDHLILFGNKKIDYFNLKNEYYENRTLNSKSSINIELKKRSIFLNLKYLNKEDYMCDLILMECDYLDEEGYKLFYDNDHMTNRGAKHFGKKIHDIKWFNLN